MCIMTNLENYQLVHPELLAEDTLLQVLKDRCIEVSGLKSTSKNELIEIFKRVALPLPQRKYDNSTYLGRKLINLRNSKGQQQVRLSTMAPISSGVESSSKTNGLGLNTDRQISDRLKPPLLGVVGTDSKKIRLSKLTTVPSTPCDAYKRKNEETLQELSNCKRRQKITWP